MFPLRLDHYRRATPPVLKSVPTLRACRARDAPRDDANHGAVWLPPGQAEKCVTFLPNRVAPL
jgi:hypothetical protein